VIPAAGRTGSPAPYSAEPDDAFATDPDELWRTVLHRKGGPFEIMVDMPFDPGLN